MATMLERVAAAAPKIQPKPPAQKAREWKMPGFGPMARITASFGDLPAQTLRVHDMVRTDSGQLVKVTSVNRIKLDSDFLSRRPEAHAVLIRAGALGHGLPKADVVVSPGQLVGLGRHAFDTKYVRAGELLGRPGIVTKNEDMLTYTTFRCAEPVSVRMEGVWAKVEA